MIMDAQLKFSDAQALTSAAASTNLVDLGAIRDIGEGQPLYLVLVVDTAFTDTGSNSTVTVDIQTDDNASFSSATTAQTAFTLAATSAAGSVYKAAIGPSLVNERYMRLYYTMVDGDLSAGAVTAGVVLNLQNEKYYADNKTITS